MKRSPIRIKSAFVAVVVLTFLIPMNVCAENPFYIAFKPGAYSPKSSDLDGYDTGFSGDIVFGFRLNRNIAAEFGLGYFNTQGRQTFEGATYVVQEDFDIDVTPVTFTLKAILPYKNWEFFGLGGVGMYFVSGPYDVNNYDYYYHNYYDYDYDYDAVFGGYLGGGLHYNITPNIFLGAEGKYLWTDKAKLSQSIYGTSFDVRFRLDGIIVNGVIGLKF
jgi:hypothetical protein